MCIPIAVRKVTPDSQAPHDTFFSGKEDEKARRKAEQRARAVLFKGFPPTATDEDLWQLFPSAKFVRVITHDGKVTGTAMVSFGSIPEAEAARAKTVEVKGKALRAIVDGLLALAARPKTRTVFARTNVPSQSHS